MWVIFPEQEVLPNHLCAVSVTVLARNPKAVRALTAVIAVDGLSESCPVKQTMQQTMQQPYTHHIVEVYGVYAVVSLCVQNVVHSDHLFLPTVQIFPRRFNPHKTASPGIEARDGKKCIGIGRLYPAFRVALVTGFISCLSRKGSEEEKENKTHVTKEIIITY